MHNVQQQQLQYTFRRHVNRTQEIKAETKHKNFLKMMLKPLYKNQENK